MNDPKRRKDAVSDKQRNMNLCYGRKYAYETEIEQSKTGYHKTQGDIIRVEAGLETALHIVSYCITGARVLHCVSLCAYARIDYSVQAVFACCGFFKKSVGRA